MSESIIDYDESTCKLEKNINELYKVKNEYEKKIMDIKKEIELLQYRIYRNCELKNNGHKWVTEREAGPYGERFTYCKFCNYEK